MSVNSFALPNYMIPPLRNLVEKGIIESSVMFWSNPPRVGVTLIEEIDLRWRVSRSGTFTVICLAKGPWNGEDDLRFVPADERDQVDDQITINTDSDSFSEWEDLRLALKQWKYDNINPIQDPQGK